MWKEYNVWVDAFSRSTESTVNLSLKREIFLDLTRSWGLPQIDLFANKTNRKVHTFISPTEMTPAGGPDTLMIPWSSWEYFTYFPLLWQNNDKSNQQDEILSRSSDPSYSVVEVSFLVSESSQVVSHTFETNRWSYRGSRQPQLEELLNLHAWSFYKKV